MFCLFEMSILRSELDEQKIASAYDFVKQGQPSAAGIQLDIKPPMGANYFRLDKAAVFWSDPSFDNSSSGTAESATVEGALSNPTVLTMLPAIAYQDCDSGKEIRDLIPGGWHICDPDKFTISFEGSGSLPNYQMSENVDSNDEALSFV
jgi:hypothetical protein